MTTQGGKAKLSREETYAYDIVVNQKRGVPGHRFLAKQIVTGLETIIRGRPAQYKDGIPVYSNKDVLLGTFTCTVDAVPTCKFCGRTFDVKENTCAVCSAKLSRGVTLTVTPRK